MADNPPNVVLLVSDQHRARSTGCYGDAHVETPHIDALAETGTLFENAYCTSPLCMPSRASLFTGTHPHTNGLVSVNQHQQQNPEIDTLLARLQDAGYRTHASGYTELAFEADDEDRDDEFTGFDTIGGSYAEYRSTVGESTAQQYRLNGIHGEFWEPAYFNVDGDPSPLEDDELYDSYVAADARSFLEDVENDDDPFFLYAGFRAVHPPWLAPDQFHERHDPDDLDDLPDWHDPPTDRKPRRLRQFYEYFDVQHYPEDLVRRSIAAYNAFVAYLDDCIGRILDRLDAIGERENTVVVYTSDHGENLYRHGLCEKHTFYEDSVHVPLLFDGPGIPAGERTDALASLVDVFPTLLGVTGTDVPDHVEGRSLEPAFDGDAVRDYVFAEYYNTLDPCRMVRGERYKYIHTEGDVDELYDLQHDPGERTNLAWYPAYADLVDVFGDLATRDWERPESPPNQYHIIENKQEQLLAGLDIADTRPEPPEWVRE